jgi:hypothetical protein
MTPWHVVVISIGAALEALAIFKGATSPEVTTIVALIIGAAAGNAQVARGRANQDNSIHVTEKNLGP